MTNDMGLWRMRLIAADSPNEAARFCSNLSQKETKSIATDILMAILDLRQK